MIGYLTGKLIQKAPTRLLLDVSGVGYELNIPLSTYDKVGELGQIVKVHTYMHVRENVHQLFGFATEEERDIFELLISVSGVGPKMALTILSGTSVEDLKSTVASEDIEKLTNIRGIGKKTAMRVTLELREKVGAMPSLAARNHRAPKSKAQILANDALSALVSLGYKHSVAREAIRKILSNGSKADLTVEELIREVLRIA